MKRTSSEVGGRVARCRRALRGQDGARALAGAAVVLALTLAGCGQPADGASAPTSTARAQSKVELPVIGQPQVVERDDVGDPFILDVTARSGGVTKPSYVLYWTTDWRSNVPTAVSSDLVHWRRVADSLPVLPTWATNSKTETWGPTVHQVGRVWVLYYSTKDAATGRECIGRGVSSSPLGPFSDTSAKPLVCQSALGGDIDPSVVTDRSGVSSLVWKNDGNAIKTPVSIWEQRLSSTGLALDGAPQRLLDADQSWENGVIEGPAMLADSAGGWWLFFSGGGWGSASYDTGVAWCATVAGPCHDSSANPFLTSRPGAISPGGFDTFVAADGKLWASYSAFPDRPANSRAALAEDRVLEIAPVLSR